MNRILGARAFVVAGFFWWCSGLCAQDTLHSPLPIPLKFSGNFGEIRTGHFHTGLDVRTEGRSGIPVLAAHEGTVSRIKVSHRGYGLALYLNGGGLTSVYAHLSAFHPDIERWLKSQQYGQEKWAFDGRPSAAFSFSAGDTLGWSGNTGGSFGPHLHFELRDAKSQRPMNPLHWTFEGAGVTQDLIPPEFRGVWVIPENTGTVEGGTDRFRWTAAYGDGLRVSGPFSLGIEGFDRLDGERFTHGPYGVDVWMNDSLVHSHRMDTLDFATNSDVSAHIDLPAWQDRKGRVHRVQRLPGNRLDIYQKAPVGSACLIGPGDSARIEVLLLDAAGNETQAGLWLWGDSLSGKADSLLAAPLEYNRSHKIEHEGIVVEVPANALYGDAAIDIEHTGPGTFKVWSEARVTRSDYTLTAPVPVEYMGTGTPMVLCILDQEGEVNGTWMSDEHDGFVQVRLDRFGRFELKQDTVAPVLEEPQLEDGILTISVEDGLSGIDRWEGRCGDHWMRWGLDKGVLSYALSDGVLDGREKEEIRVWSIDATGNIGHRVFTLDGLKP